MCPTCRPCLPLLPRRDRELQTLISNTLTVTATSTLSGITVPDSANLLVGTGTTTLGGALDAQGGATVSLDATATTEDVLAVTADNSGKPCELGTGLAHESPGDVVHLAAPEDLLVGHNV